MESLFFLSTPFSPLLQNFRDVLKPDASKLRLSQRRQQQQKEFILEANNYFNLDSNYLEHEAFQEIIQNKGERKKTKRREEKEQEEKISDQNLHV